MSGDYNSANVTVLSEETPKTVLKYSAQDGTHNRETLGQNIISLGTLIQKINFKTQLF